MEQTLVIAVIDGRVRASGHHRPGETRRGPSCPVDRAGLPGPQPQARGSVADTPGAPTPLTGHWQPLCRSASLGLGPTSLSAVRWKHGRGGPSGPAHLSHAAWSRPSFWSSPGWCWGSFAASPHVRPTRTGTLRSPGWRPSPRLREWLLGPCCPPACPPSQAATFSYASRPQLLQSMAPACKRGTMLSRQAGRPARRPGCP